MIHDAYYELSSDDLRREFKRIKGSLTRGEKALTEGDHARALRVARDAFEDFERIGYPDWWSRAERLRQDALLAGAMDRGLL